MRRSTSRIGVCMCWGVKHWTVHWPVLLSCCAQICCARTSHGKPGRRRHYTHTCHWEFKESVCRRVKIRAQYWQVKPTDKLSLLKNWFKIKWFSKYFDSLDQQQKNTVLIAARTEQYSLQMTLFKKSTSYYINYEKLQAMNLQHLRDIIMSIWSELCEELQAPQEFYTMRKWCVRTPFSHAEACLTLPSFSAGLHSRCSRLEDAQACVCAFPTMPGPTCSITLDWAQVCSGTSSQCWIQNRSHTQ